MRDRYKVLVLSDIHYASEAEKARGFTESAVIAHPFQRLLARAFRHFVWRSNPHAHNHGVDLFLRQADQPDWIIANGDYSCDSAFVGISDDATYQSACECLECLRRHFPGRFQATYGDHELGKMSLFGGCGGMRLASWERAEKALGLKPFWQVNLGQYRLVGVASSLVALPVYEPETLPEERDAWYKLRANHLAEIHGVFETLNSGERVLLFCHDPTALPFLWESEAIQARADQIEQTFMGHLHSNLFLWESRVLAGMPRIGFLGNSIRRMSTALNAARHWRPFKVRLCPALTGIELVGGGGFYEIRLDGLGVKAVEYIWHPLLRANAAPGLGL